MPWPLSAVNSGPRRLSQAHGITETCQNSQQTCSAASCSSPADRPDVQSQDQARELPIAVRQHGDVMDLAALGPLEQDERVVDREAVDCIDAKGAEVVIAPLIVGRWLSEHAGVKAPGTANSTVFLPANSSSVE